MIKLGDLKLVDILPESIRSDSNVRACAEAIDRELKAVTRIIPNTSILHHIDELPEQWVDEIAYQWRTPFYDPTLTIEERRELVKNSLALRRRNGTPSAIEDLISQLFGSGAVEEWYEYGGDPYHFRVTTSDPLATAERAALFIRSVNAVKNVRSWFAGVQIEETVGMDLYFGMATQTADTLTVEQED